MILAVLIDGAGRPGVLGDVARSAYSRDGDQAVQAIVITDSR
jgi:hypothetical protein